MKIEGLKRSKRIRTDGTIQLDFTPVGRVLADRIRLTINPEGGAIVSYLDTSGLKPDAESGEIISIHRYDESIAKRIVSAFAVMHLRLEEVETNYTASDTRMINNRFVVGLYDNAHPAWVKKVGNVYNAILNSDSTGLPSSLSEPVQARLILPKGRTIVYDANNLDDGLRFIKNGQIWSSLSSNESLHLIAGPPPGKLLN